jgi:cobalt/nickel transport system permease protein
VVLMKARTTAEDVHSAMVARGFRGDVKTLDEPRLGARDMLAIALAAAWATAMVLLGRAGLP